MRSPVHTSAWLTAVPPSVAIEIASTRVTVVEVVRAGSSAVIARHASERLPEGAVTPALVGLNLTQPSAVADALGRAFETAGLSVPKRAALVIPDSAARLSLVPLDEVPARPADVEALLRWQLRKSTPFPLEETRLSHFVASRESTGSIVAATIARLDVLEQYESIPRAFGIHSGIVDLASLNVMNTVVGAGAAPKGDWLIVHVAADASTLAILRGESLLFYRHRPAIDDDSLGSLVHQTAMYHEDRLGGGPFARVWVCGDAADNASREVAARLGVNADVVDVRKAADLRDRIDPSPALLDALAAPVGVLIRELRVA